MRAFRVVIAGHGALAAGLLAGAQMIAGELPEVAIAALEAGMTSEEYDARLATTIGAGPALVLCDLHGGTPHNRAQLLTRRGSGSICLAGANLAMVLEAVLADGELNLATVSRIVAAGRRDITEPGSSRPC
jgi:mannose/fructose-specific phosphotransferase system component IIA